MALVYISERISHIVNAGMPPPPAYYPGMPPPPGYPGAPPPWGAPPPYGAPMPWGAPPGMPPPPGMLCGVHPPGVLCALLNRVHLYYAVGLPHGMHLGVWVIRPGAAPRLAVSFAERVAPPGVLCWFAVLGATLYTVLPLLVLYGLL